MLTKDSSHISFGPHDYYLQWCVCFFSGVHRQESSSIDRGELTSGASLSRLSANARLAQHHDPFCTGTAVQLQTVFRSHPSSALALRKRDAGNMTCVKLSYVMCGFKVQWLRHWTYDCEIMGWIPRLSVVSCDPGHPHAFAFVIKQYIWIL